MNELNIPGSQVDALDTLLAFFDLSETQRPAIVEGLVPHVKKCLTTKYQVLEEPGPAANGLFMMVLQGLADSYYHCPFEDKLWGRHVYYRHDVIFAPASFHEGVARTDYIRALEPSAILTLPYHAMYTLAEQFEAVHTKLHAISAKQTQDLLAYNLRNTLPAKARIRAFLEQHPTLPHRTTAEICAMHNHMSRYWYCKTRQGILTAY